MLLYRAFITHYNIIQNIKCAQLIETVALFSLENNKQSAVTVIHGIYDCMKESFAFINKCMFVHVYVLFCTCVSMTAWRVFCD